MPDATRAKATLWHDPCHPGIDVASHRKLTHGAGQGSFARPFI
jgi:hypothetical protein